MTSNHCGGMDDGAFNKNFANDVAMAHEVVDPVLVDAEPLPHLIIRKASDETSDNTEVGTILQKAHLFFQAPGVRQIISVHARDEVAPAQFQTPVQRGYKASMGLECRPQPGIGLLAGAQNGSASVGGAVIHGHYFKILHCLVLQAFHSGFKGGGGVIYGHENCDAGRGHAGSILDRMESNQRSLSGIGVAACKLKGCGTIVMIHLKSAREIERIRASCRVAAETMALVMKEIAPGVTTLRLDQVAAAYIRGQDAQASAKGYRGFPRSICVSVNEEVVHGIPGQRVLEEGDILAVDIAVKKDGYHGDMNVSTSVGRASEEAQRLLYATRQSMERGLEAALAGKRLGDIGHAIQSYAEANGYSVVREYCGHGLGRSFHEEPQLLHFGEVGTGRRLLPGMVFTIEPMINQGDPETRLLEDNWTAVTADGNLSAQFEHTVAVTRNGPDILSRFDDFPF